MPALLDTHHSIATHTDYLFSRRSAIALPSIDTHGIQLQQMPKRDQAVIQQGIIPTYYDMSGPKPGTVIGIVLGSVAAFLFVAWLIYTIVTGGFSGIGGRTAITGEEEIIVRRRRTSRGGRSRTSRRHEMREVDRSPRTSGGRSQIVVEERRSSNQRPRSIVVEERRRVPGDDVVEVIEEHEEYRERRGSRRRSPGYRY